MPKQPEELKQLIAAAVEVGNNELALQLLSEAIGIKPTSAPHP